MQCLESKSECPNCRKQYPQQPRRRAELMVKNFSVESSIDELRIHCKYGLRMNADDCEWVVDDKGCKEVLRVCDFSFPSCACVHVHVHVHVCACKIISPYGI